MKILRREIHPAIRVLDERAGLVEYVASDETLDSYREVIMAAGWRFTDFRKNSPFLDSHKSGSIEALLGRVEDFKVAGRRLVETVKWAVDVAENTLAQKGFAMTKAGYLKAVSVGFYPTKYVSKFDSNQNGWKDALKELRLTEETGVSRVYLEQEQKELSACVIGANPNALSKAHSDGILTEADLDYLSRAGSKGARQIIEAPSRRTFSFATPSSDRAVTEMTQLLRSRLPATQPESTMSKQTFTTEFEQLTRSTKTRFDDVETARRHGSESELEHAIRLAFTSLVREQRHSFGDPLAHIRADEEKLATWRALGKHACKWPMNHEERQLVSRALSSDSDLVDRALSPADGGLGAAQMLAEPVSNDVFDAVLSYGAFRTLGVHPMASQKTKFAKCTALPSAAFILPAAQGSTTLTPDSSLAGSSITPECNTIAALIEVSEEVLADEKVDLGLVFLEKFSQGIAARIDFACFSGTGAADADNGSQTGIFIDNAVAIANAVAGNTTVEGLQRGDFLRAVGSVAAAALQRECRWWLNPSFLAGLMNIKDGSTGFLLKSPAETRGEWALVGFPCTWTAQAPSTNAAATKVAAFGHGPAYLFGMRNEFEIMYSGAGSAFNRVMRKVRALSRGLGSMRAATFFSTLKTAAQ